MNPTVSRCADCDGKLSPCHFSVAHGTQHHALLNSNEAPLESDAVTAVVRVIARLREQQFEDSERLNQLTEEQVLLSNYRAANHAIFSPLRRMPLELLSEIFGWTLTSARSQLIDRPEFIEKESPWVLTHVCRTWRAVAVSTPALWSILILDYVALAPSSSYPLDMVETHIRRAQNLRIKFHGLSDRHESNKIEIFRCLVKYASRWEELLLEPTESLCPFLDSLRDCVPLLRRVRIRSHDHRNLFRTAAQSFDFINTAPSLVDFTLSDHLSSFAFHPSSQLTRYELWAPLKIHQGILKLAPRLSEAHIMVAVTGEPRPDAHEIIILPSVRRLHTSEAEFLDCIRAPGLEELSLYLRVRNWSHVDPFLARSLCPLQCLCIFGSYPKPHEILAVLNKIPSLIELRITPTASAEQANALLAGLTAVEIRTVAPQLICISVAPTFWIVDSFDFRAYAKMIKSRFESQECALTSTKLCMFSPSKSDSLLARARSSLDPLQGNGSQVMLLTGREALETTACWTYTSEF
ncbi:F-box domain-containing protein [Mycena sanguinolenta]|uniref:F-box domain-containing protein n=1 Tax=Mycena sanguinolenta TaxID=230812 RepID=A0A8H6X8N0_9AGAR|nr:F-box domain-containing protein [Mycena sanguinolenta]